MCVVPWLAEKLQIILKDICLWDKQTAIEWEYINSNYNNSLQIANGKEQVLWECDYTSCLVKQ